MSCMLLSQEYCDLSSVARKQPETVDSKRVCWACINTCSSLFWAHWSYRRMLPTLICTSWLMCINRTLSFIYYNLLFCFLPCLPWTPHFPHSVLSLSCSRPLLIHTHKPAKNQKEMKAQFFSIPSYPLPPDHSELFPGAGLRPQPIRGQCRCCSSSVPPRQAEQPQPGQGA